MWTRKDDSQHDHTHQPNECTVNAKSSFAISSTGEVWFSTHQEHLESLRLFYKNVALINSLLSQVKTGIPNHYCRNAIHDPNVSQILYKKNELIGFALGYTSFTLQCEYICSS